VGPLDTDKEKGKKKGKAKRKVRGKSMYALQKNEKTGNNAMVPGVKINCSQERIRQRWGKVATSGQKHDLLDVSGRANQCVKSYGGKKTC